jgi:hypothetical protein
MTVRLAFILQADTIHAAVGAFALHWEALDANGPVLES